MTLLPSNFFCHRNDKLQVLENVSKLLSLFRYIPSLSTTFTLIYTSSKHLHFQPCNKDWINEIHLHPSNVMMINSKAPFFSWSLMSQKDHHGFRRWIESYGILLWIQHLGLGKLEFHTFPPPNKKTLYQEYDVQTLKLVEYCIKMLHVNGNCWKTNILHIHTWNWVSVTSWLH